MLAFTSAADISTSMPPGLRGYYDQSTDRLFVLGADMPAEGQYLSEDLWLVRDRATQQIAGFFIEDFDQSFVPRHEELASLWGRIKPGMKGLSLVPPELVRIVSPIIASRSSELLGAFGAA